MELVGIVTGAILGGVAVLTLGWKLVRWLVRNADKLDQLAPNGGSSVRDQVVQTRADVAEIKQQMFDQEKRQGRIEQRQDHQGRVLDEILLELRRG